MPDDLFPLTSRAAFEAQCRERVSALYIGDRTLLSRIMGRFLCYLDADDAAVAPHLAMDGFWEAWNSLALARHVQPGWRVADVGANHGYFTLLLAALVGGEGRVFAVEPNPRLVDLLGRTVRVNGFSDRVTLLPYAAAAGRGESELRVPRGFSGDGSIVLQRPGAFASCRVPRRRLDELIGAPVDFLKIDVEGADYDVLDGAAGLLAPDRPAAVLLEHYAPFHEQPAQPLERLLAAGFTLRYVTYDGDLAAATIADLAAEPGRFWDVWLSREPRPS
jgi:FkbM family methyltransferase